MDLAGGRCGYDNITSSSVAISDTTTNLLSLDASSVVGVASAVPEMSI